MSRNQKSKSVTIRIDGEVRDRLEQVRRELYQAGNPNPTWSDAIRSEIQMREADARQRASERDDLLRTIEALSKS